MDQEKLEKILKYIKEFFANEYSGHDYWHSYRVYKMAEGIVKEKEETRNLQ